MGLFKSPAHGSLRCAWRWLGSQRLLLFSPLVEHGDHIHFFAIEQDASTFDSEVWNEDGGQRGVKDWDEVAALIGDQGDEVEASRDFEFTFQFIDACDQAGG